MSAIGQDVTSRLPNRRAFGCISVATKSSIGSHAIGPDVSVDSSPNGSASATRILI